MTRLSPETLDISLDASLDVPLNEQVYRSLRMMIGRRLAAGDRLPASRDLARALKVGRVTVTTAYARLKAEGFLEAKPGGRHRRRRQDHRQQSGGLGAADGSRKTGFSGSRAGEGAASCPARRRSGRRDRLSCAGARAACRH